MSLPNFDHMPVASGTDVDRLLVLADGTLINDRRSAISISIAAMRVIKDGRFGLRYLETRFRALDSRTFLIGLPKKYSPEFEVTFIDNKPAP